MAYDAPNNAKMDALLASGIYQPGTRLAAVDPHSGILSLFAPGTTVIQQKGSSAWIWPTVFDANVSIVAVRLIPQTATIQTSILGVSMLIGDSTLAPNNPPLIVPPFNITIGTEELAVTAATPASNSDTLNGAMTSAQTSLVTSSASGWPAVPFNLLVDSEVMTATAGSLGSFTVTRGVNGTTAAAHLSGAAVATIPPWTVTRGVNGTTAAAHTAGVTISYVSLIDFGLYTYSIVGGTPTLTLVASVGQTHVTLLSEQRIPLSFAATKGVHYFAALGVGANPLSFTYLETIPAASMSLGAFGESTSRPGNVCPLPTSLSANTTPAWDGIGSFATVFQPYAVFEVA